MANLRSSPRPYNYSEQISDREEQHYRVVQQQQQQHCQSESPAKKPEQHVAATNHSPHRKFNWNAQWNGIELDVRWVAGTAFILAILADVIVNHLFGRCHGGGRGGVGGGTGLAANTASQVDYVVIGGKKFAPV